MCVLQGTFETGASYFYLPGGSGDQLGRKRRRGAASTKLGPDYGPDHGPDHGPDRGPDHGSDHRRKKSFEKK